MTLVHSDSRGRISLGRMIEAERAYRVTMSPHGTVTLEPVTVVSEYERRLLERPDIVAKLDEGIAHLDEGRRIRRERSQRAV